MLGQTVIKKHNCLANHAENFIVNGIKLLDSFRIIDIIKDTFIEV